MKHLILHINLILLVVLSVVGCTTESRRMQMRAELDSINALNRTDKPFSVQDVEPYVQFFESHGSPNDRLLAHYLLGRAYYLRGEAPMALQCYHNAVDCADTTAQDCDYAQLSRVYGQMAEIFGYQGLYRHQLTYDKLSVKYAWLGKDTLAALMGYELESYAYRDLGMIDSSICIIEDVALKYKQYGYSKQSAISLGAIMRPLLNRSEYQKAKKCLDIYEGESGLFDVQGIEEGREIYYNIKGYYYLGIGNIDSAEYYFRKELQKGKDLNNQNAGALGLADLYQRTHQSDSVAKYSFYASAIKDSLYAQRTIETVARMQSMYDYTRNQEIAQKERENVFKEKKKLYSIATSLILLLLIAAFAIYRMHIERERQKELYLRNLEELEQTQNEILQLRIHADEYEELLASKEKQLKMQNAEMQMHRRKELFGHSNIEENLRKSDIYQKLLKKQYGQVLSGDELRECRKLIIENLPEFNNVLLSKQYKLNSKDFNVCILFRLGFKSKEISNMLDISQGRVSQICTKVLFKVFGKESGGASELIAELHELF